MKVVVHLINDKLFDHFSIHNNVSSNIITIKDTVFQHIKDDLFEVIGVTTHDYTQHRVKTTKDIKGLDIEGIEGAKVDKHAAFQSH